MSVAAVLIAWGAGSLLAWLAQPVGGALVERRHNKAHQRILARRSK